MNNSARAMMGQLAKAFADWHGANVTSGTSTAYTLTSNQGFDTLAHMGGQRICFTPHTTNGAVDTLSVDGLTAEPLRSAPSVELGAGVIIQGTPYCAVYNSSDAAFYLVGFFANQFTVPVGGMIVFPAPLRRIATSSFLAVRRSRAPPMRHISICPALAPPTARAMGSPRSTCRICAAP